MPTGAPNPKVEFFFAKPSPWQAAYGHLRTIALGCGLTEELKYGCPAYTLEGKSVVLIHGFKDYCALLFYKGVLMRDDAGLLVQQTPNVQAARQLRFASAEAVRDLEPTVKAYVLEAAQLERSGAKVALKPTAEFAVCAEFRRALDGDARLRDAFEALTPGRQRGYLLHFAAPKLAKTRADRVEKFVPRILEGLGLDD